jgi:general control protein GCN4
VPLFYSNSNGSLDPQNLSVTDYQNITMAGGGMYSPGLAASSAHRLTPSTEVNVAYAGTFGDLSSAGAAGLFDFNNYMDDFDAPGDGGFTAVSSNDGVPVGTISPKDVYNDSVPPSTSFTNLTTPGSTYLDTPDDSLQVSPMYDTMDTAKTWPSLFPEEDEDVTNSFSMAPEMMRTTSSSSTNQIIVHPGGESVQRKRSSVANSPVPFSPVIKHSTVAGVNARRRDKPLPPIVVNEDDPVALKRARNTAAARKSRAKRVLEREEMQERIDALQAEVDHWKAIALGQKKLEPTN